MYRVQLIFAVVFMLFLYATVRADVGEMEICEGLGAPPTLVCMDELSESEACFGITESGNAKVAIHKKTDGHSIIRFTEIFKREDIKDNNSVIIELDKTKSNRKYFHKVNFKYNRMRGKASFWEYKIKGGHEGAEDYEKYSLMIRFDRCQTVEP